MSAAASIRQVLCISWNPELARKREQIFEQAGCRVITAVGPQEAAEALREPDGADLLVIGYSVPREEKRRFMRQFRQRSEAPILSLLDHNQEKLPEATLGVPGTDYARLAEVVRHIVG